MASPPASTRCARRRRRGRRCTWSAPTKPTPTVSGEVELVDAETGEHARGRASAWRRWRRIASASPPGWLTREAECHASRHALRARADRSTAGRGRARRPAPRGRPPMTSPARAARARGSARAAADLSRALAVRQPPTPARARPSSCGPTCRSRRRAARAGAGRRSRCCCCCSCWPPRWRRVALARPATPTDPPRHVALVLDASASMQATDVAPTRFDAARARRADATPGVLRPDRPRQRDPRRSRGDAAGQRHARQRASAPSAATPGLAPLRDSRSAGPRLQRSRADARAPGRDRPAHRRRVAAARDRRPARRAGRGRGRRRRLGQPGRHRARRAHGSERARPDGLRRARQRGRPPGARRRCGSLADGAPLDERQVDIAARGRARLSIPLPVDAHHISVRLLGQDALSLDDAIERSRPAARRATCDLVGRISDGLRRALESIPSLHVRPHRRRQIAAARSDRAAGVSAAQLPASGPAAAGRPARQQRAPARRGPGQRRAGSPAAPAAAGPRPGRAAGTRRRRSAACPAGRTSSSARCRAR